jgi:DNA-binding NtrC family response regulator
VIAATDKDLEDEVVHGRFDDALFFRLNVYPIQLPSLRSRPADVGVLFFSFLKGYLKRGGGAERLRDHPDRPPWIPARSVVRLALAPWPGNVRELLHLAEHLVIESTDHPDLDVDAFVRTALADSARLVPESPAPPAPLPSPAEPQNKRSKISLQQLLDALVAAKWNKSAAARTLGLSRQTFYQLIGDDHPAVEKALLIPYDDIVRQYSECGADVEALAAKLEIPADVLLCRLQHPKR